MCQIMVIARSTYYEWLNGPESSRDKWYKELLVKIKQLHKESHYIYGSPNITKDLNDMGIAVSRGTVDQLMKRHGIRSKICKKYKATTNSNHNLPVEENIINREFSAKKMDLKWVSDINYIWTDEGWLYLAGIPDLYDGAIVGWLMDKRMKKELVIDALESVCIRRRPEAGVIL